MSITFYNDVKFFKDVIVHKDITIMGNLTIMGEINTKFYIDSRLKEILISQGVLTEDILQQYIDSIEIMDKLTGE